MSLAGGSLDAFPGDVLDHATLLTTPISAKASVDYINTEGFEPLGTIDGMQPLTQMWPLLSAVETYFDVNLNDIHARVQWLWPGLGGSHAVAMAVYKIICQLVDRRECFNEYTDMMKLIEPTQPGFQDGVIAFFQMPVVATRHQGQKYPDVRTVPRSWMRSFNDKYDMWLVNHRLRRERTSGFYSQKRKFSDAWLSFSDSSTRFIVELLESQSFSPDAMLEEIKRAKDFKRSVELDAVADRLEDDLDGHPGVLVARRCGAEGSMTLFVVCEKGLSFSYGGSVRLTQVTLG
jgi:hypothetical protein